MVAAGAVDRLELERGHQHDLVRMTVGGERGAKGRRHRNAPLAVDLVHESGQKQFHSLPPTLFPKRPARGGPGCVDEFPPTSTRVLGDHGIAWDEMGRQHDILIKPNDSKCSAKNYLPPTAYS